MINTLNYENSKCSDTNAKAGRGCAGGLTRSLPPRAARPAGGYWGRGVAYERAQREERDRGESSTYERATLRMKVLREGMGHGLSSAFY